MSTPPEPAAPRIDVLFAADAGYFQHIAVAASSVAATSRHPDIHIHVMTCDRDAAAEARLARSLAPRRNLTLHVHHVADDRLADVFVDSYLTKETYLRFFAGEVLPAEVGRVVYLDGDLVVTDDIAKLHAVDLGGKAIAGAPELDWWGSAPGNRLERLGIRPGHRYFNAGVLVIDLDFWRREGVRDKLFAYALARGNTLECHDQDVLNAVLQDDAVALDRRWNVETLWYSSWVRRTFPRDHAELRPALANPGIVHYSTIEKPWKYRAWTRKRGLYFDHLDRTEWRDETPKGLSGLRRAEYRLSRRLLRAGIDVNALVSVGRHGRALADRLRGREAAPSPARAGGGDGRAPIDVLFCADRLYLQHVAVAAVSLAASARGRALRIHVLTCDAESEGEAKLRASLRPWPTASVTIHRVAPERLDRLFVAGHVTREAYLRFLAPEMLPAEVERVIYLDVDLVVLDDITGLWEADLGGKPVGAVREVDWAEAAPDARAAALGIAPGHTYVNSGVMVMDLVQWRRDGLCARLLDCAAALGSRATYFDQDALNVALQGEIALLDRRWNVQTLMLGSWYRRAMPADHAASAAARRDPGIVHFSTGAKPWKFRARTRRRADYYRFRDRTAWRGVPPDGLGAVERFEHGLARTLLTLGIDPYMAAAAGERLGARVAAQVARLRAPAVGASEDARS